MKVSAKAEYACLAMIALAQERSETPVRIREIAEAQAIPERYLVQILLQLKGAGLVTSTRGALGGYRLARPPGSISVQAVLESIDGPDDTSVRESGSTGGRALALIWEEVRAAERSVLERITIADLAARTSPREWVI
jgi:Rrf2 family protein